MSSFGFLGNLLLCIPITPRYTRILIGICHGKMEQYVLIYVSGTDSKCELNQFLCWYPAVLVHQVRQQDEECEQLT